MSNKDIYKQLCETSKEIPLFEQPWWLDVVCKQWDVAIARKGDRIAGTWPYPIEKKLGLTLIRTPKLTPYMGPQVFFPKDLKESNTDNFEHETVLDLIKQLPKSKVWHLAVQPGMRQVGIFKNHKLSPQVQQTFLVELNESEDTLLANMKDTTRRNIRIAEGEVIVSNSPEHLKQLYHFQKETLSKKGLTPAYSFREMEHIMNACIANDACRLWVAKEGKKIVAIVWQVWDNKCSYYFMGGQNPESNNYRAMSLLLWHTIKEAKKQGNTLFDLEGSMDEGVERFFRNFGGERAMYMVLQKNKSFRWWLKKLIFK